MVKIILTGAQGTGKTTILNEFKKKGWDVITEVVRNLSKQGVKINEMGDAEGQKKIYDTYVKLFKNKKQFVSDRGLTDVMAYTAYLVHQRDTKELSDLFLDQYKQWLRFSKDNPDMIYCYFPIEFPVVNDGVRSMSEEFRKEVDAYIKTFFEESGMPYVEVRGTVEERVKIIEDVLADLKESGKL